MPRARLRGCIRQHLSGPLHLGSQATQSRPQTVSPGLVGLENTGRSKLTTARMSNRYPGVVPIAVAANLIFMLTFRCGTAADVNTADVNGIPGTEYLTRY